MDTGEVTARISPETEIALHPIGLESQLKREINDA